MSKKTLLIVRVLAFVAMVIASYLAWTSLHKDATLAGCGEGSGCEQVLQTRWSTWFGLPVSVGAVGTYVAIFILTFFISEDRPKAWVMLVFLTVLASLSAIWFIALQVFVIHAYCKYCDVVHACGLVLTFLVLKNLPLRKSEPPEKSKKKKTSPPTGIPAAQFAYAAAVAVLGAAVLVYGQTRTEGVTPETTSNSGGVAGTSCPVKTGKMAKDTIPVNVGEFPTLGSINAERFVAHIFDYTCPACRKLHPDLIAAQQPNQQHAALTLIPAPLDSACNPGISQTAYIHLNGCNYAKIGLAVWRTKPEAYLAYDHFMFEGEYPPPVEQASSYAAQLVGQDALTRALADPQIDVLLRIGVSMFYSPALERKVLPIIMTPEKIFYGIPDAPEIAQLFK
jgi:uncharacterized membrane protein